MSFANVYRLAEARRKKVQELEKKIAESTRKCLEQNKLIKTKEKQDQKIKSLANEIQSLKETRVKLIRQMRNDANHFTKWKQSREKEINRLRAQDRKRVNEMVRLKMQHNKQETVFKRKMEEAFAANKRLKVCIFPAFDTIYSLHSVSFYYLYYLIFFLLSWMLQSLTGCVGDTKQGNTTTREKDKWQR